MILAGTLKFNTDSMLCSFRAGYVLGVKEHIDHNSAIDFGHTLAENSNILTSRYHNIFKKMGIQYEDAQNEVRVFTANKTIVRFNDIKISINDQVIVLGATCTVCEDDLHSKIWIRASSAYEDKEIERLVQTLLDTLKEFYAEQYLDEFSADKESLSIEHSFYISSTDLDDPEFVDVYKDLLRTGSIQHSIRKGKDRTLNSLFDAAKLDYDKKQDESNLLQLWEDRLQTKWKKVLVPEVDKHRGIFIVDIDDEAQITRCRGISNEFAFALSERDQRRIQPSSHFTTAKLSRVLASNL